MKQRFYSTSGYDRIREDGLILPHSRTVEKRVVLTPLTTGCLRPVLQNLKQEVQEMPECARRSIAKFDEMDIMEKLDYDSSKDIIEGFEALGPLRRTARRANKVFAMTLNSFVTFNPWRALIFYALPYNGVSAKHLVTLIRMCMDEATECGADVQMIVCDQEGSNRSAYTQLCVTTENPLFYHKNPCHARFLSRSQKFNK
ncbi:uncharacterized protein LOC117175638 [Belonocnema kinseyi]|uniref:uncharacterized protein LOC117175638 n=1 Tax=Belonocnema kinseyi TaxID=2817044 RepID=UPI00143D8C96|nr:uncharacterized protein LOC117175638 [Belonocnema kinseyi]